jgi:hypothetical protein
MQLLNFRVYFNRSRRNKMTTAIIESKYTEEETKEFRAKCADLKSQIKELASIQKEEKSLLRTPHYKLKSKGSGLGGTAMAGRLMYRCLRRADEITVLHIEYNKLRGKPYNMHLHCK